MKTCPVRPGPGGTRSVRCYPGATPGSLATFVRSLPAGNRHHRPAQRGARACGSDVPISSSGVTLRRTRASASRRRGGRILRVRDHPGRARALRRAVVHATARAPGARRRDRPARRRRHAQARARRGDPRAPRGQVPRRGPASPRAARSRPTRAAERAAEGRDDRCRRERRARTVPRPAATGAARPPAASAAERDETLGIELPDRSGRRRAPATGPPGRPTPRAR